MDCTTQNKKQVKLDKVVNAAIVDSWEDVGKMYQRASFVAARGLKKMYTEALPRIKHKVWLTVNSNTHTATLPLDFEEEEFVGFVDSRWHKVPIKLNNRLTDRKNVLDTDCDDTKCPKCAQDTGICNDLVVTEETNLIIINNTTYEETVIKKLYPNGDYYLETSTPVLNLETEEVDYHQKKEFIVNFDLLPCGCLTNNELNTSNLQTYCPEIYCNYYAPCDTTCCTTVGGYKIFEESGLIQMDTSYPYAKVYLEYYGFISKIRGQYYVPMVSFETLVEWTKWKLVANRKNVPLWERTFHFENYVRERRNMEKVLGRISLWQIVQAISLLPKFDVDYSYTNWYGCFSAPAVTDDATAAAVAAALAAAGVSAGGGTNTSTSTSTVVNNTTIINRTTFILNVKVDGEVGSPVAGQVIYQNNVLIGAYDLVYIILAKQVLTLKDGDFTFDAVTGQIDISPNIFVQGDTLIAHYNKNID